MARVQQPLFGKGETPVSVEKHLSTVRVSCLWSYVLGRDIKVGRQKRRFVLRKHDDMLRSSARARGASLGSRNGKIHQISAGVLDLGQAGGRVG